jgi:hypothetical protein
MCGFHSYDSGKHNRGNLVNVMNISVPYSLGICRSQWPRGLRRRSAVSRLLRSCVRIPPGAWLFVCCECRVLLCRGLYDELITRPEESYRLWCVVVCDLESSRMRRPWPVLGRSVIAKKNTALYRSHFTVQAEYYLKFTTRKLQEQSQLQSFNSVANFCQHCKKK